MVVFFPLSAEERAGKNTLSFHSGKRKEHPGQTPKKSNKSQTLKNIKNMETNNETNEMKFFTKEIAARIDAKKLCGMECVMMRRKDEFTLSQGEQAIAIAIMLKGGMSVDGVSCLLDVEPAKVALVSLILRAMGVIY